MGRVLGSLRVAGLIGRSYVSNYMGRRSDKRERLVAAACDVLYEQGLRGTSLGDIAERANVPLGNVYYYFKTKDDLARAVIAERKRAIEARSADIDDSFSEPRDRLREYVRRAAKVRARVATYGCPYGTLAQELGKGGGPLATEAGDLLRTQATWIATQYTSLGSSPAEAKKQALELVATMQGASLLTHALSDPTIMKRRFAEIERSLAPSKGA